MYYDIRIKYLLRPNCMRMYVPCIKTFCNFSFLYTLFSVSNYCFQFGGLLISQSPAKLALKLLAKYISRLQFNN